MNDFVDFELLIERLEKRYRARVLRSPAGRGAKSTFHLPLEADLEDFGSEIAMYRSVPRNLRTDHPLSMEPRELGRQLFEAVFSGEVQELWRSSLAVAESRLRLRLRLEDDSRLLRVPWELLFDPKRQLPIAIERPVVRSLEIQSSREPLIVDGPLRVLTVLSCPLDVPRLDLREEWGKLDKALGEDAHLSRVPPRLPDVDRALREEKWHVLHFVGHGEVDERGGSLILEAPDGASRVVDHARLGTFLGHESLRLIVLNACEGATPGPSVPFSGVAQFLAKREVPAVIAMQRPVSDDAAIAFAQAFYTAMAKLPPVDFALLEARRALFQEHDTEWFAPVLYLTSKDGDLFRRAQPRTRPWWLLAAVVLGVLLLGAVWHQAGKQAGTLPVPLLLQPPPRDASLNPSECPSPQNLNMAFVRVPPGPFTRGQEGGAKEDDPSHEVRIAKAFCLGMYEVTQEQWDLVMSKSATRPEDRYLPARRITFKAAQEFIRQLNQNDPSKPYRLPTEAEWEYAARAGTNTVYSFGDDPEALGPHGNCREHGDGYEGPAPVGRFNPNGWGLHDMYGNVFEWVADWYSPYTKRPVADPRGPTRGTKRIRRGGSWESRAEVCSSAARSAVNPAPQRKENGFRIVREIR
jgi:formylglycine-generating enzyme required for sulfatase activity